MNYYVTFLNKFGVEKRIGECGTIEEARAIIYDYLTARNIKSYYQRYYHNNPIVVDYGSHSEFFHIYTNEGISTNDR